MVLSGPEPLHDQHVLDGFGSGVPSLDDWLKRRARANQASDASRTFVMAAGRTVVAYYVIASAPTPHPTSQTGANPGCTNR